MGILYIKYSINGPFGREYFNYMANMYIYSSGQLNTIECVRVCMCVRRV